MTKELKGRHVLMIAIGAFAVIITANMTMLFAATGSFPGLVVKNSYVAGVGWNDRTADQQALGWTPQVSYHSGNVAIMLTDAQGVAVDAGVLQVTIGRPATDVVDSSHTLSGATNHHVPMELPPGKWIIRIRADGDQPFHTVASLYVPEPD